MHRYEGPWRIRGLIAVALAGASLVLLGCGAKLSGDYQPTADDWATVGYNLDQTRHVPFTDINPSNIGKLGLAYVVDLQRLDPSVPGGEESSPLEINGKIFITTAFNQVFAFDAATGKMLWHFKPDKIGAFKNFGINANRGLAYCDGRLFEQTLDMRIFAIDPDTGKLLQEIQTSSGVPDAKIEYGYFQTGAVVCFDDKIFVGSGGSDSGVRGYLMAFNARDLSPAWRTPHWNVPPAGEGWRSHGKFHGGGSSWNAAAVDPSDRTIYFSTANASPDYFAEMHPEGDQWADSLFAADAETGQTRWVRQQLQVDEWDYDTAQSPMVYSAKVNGQTRRVASVANKEGRLFVYDAATGAPIYNGIQVVDTINHPRLIPEQDVTVEPSNLGGVNYAASSYDPDRNILVVNSINSKTIMRQQSPDLVDKDRVRGDADTGSEDYGHVLPGWQYTGRIQGVDLGTGKVAWVVRVPQPERGGSTTTASGLTFAGGQDGVLRAIDTSTGKVLWQFQTGIQIAAAPVVFRWQGVEYVAIALGGTRQAGGGGGKYSQLAVFKLGGALPQRPAPVIPSVAEVGTPPGRAAAEHLIATEGPLAIYLQPDKAGGLDMQLVAGGGAAGGMNFNGFAHGDMTFTVPKGTLVHVTFKNLSADMPHSVLVTDWAHRESADFPLAFPGATTPDPAVGISSGAVNFTFTPDKTGIYAIVCGIPGHAAAGMWITLKVVDSGPATVEASGERTFSLATVK